MCVRTNAQCEGDTDVNYAGGRRGVGRDPPYGINHFDLNGECGDDGETRFCPVFLCPVFGASPPLARATACSSHI